MYKNGNLPTVQSLMVVVYYIVRKEGAMMANVFDTAKYILEQSGPMSTMKLQKLCYYSQAWSLVWDDSPLFEEDFQAWANGPVCTKLFFKTQGKYSASASDETGGDGDLSENQKALPAQMQGRLLGNNAIFDTKH